MRDNTTGKILLKIDNEFEVINLDLSKLIKTTYDEFDIDIMHFSTSQEKLKHNGVQNSFFNAYLSPTYLSIISKHSEPMMAIEFEGELNKEVLEIASILLKLHYYYKDIKSDNILLAQILQMLNENNIYYVNNEKSIKKAATTLVKLVKDVQNNKIEEIKLTSLGEIITAPPIQQSNEEWFGNAIIYDKAEKLPPKKEKRFILYKNQLIEVSDKQEFYI